MNRKQYLEGLLENSSTMWAELAKLSLPEDEGCSMLDALRDGANAYKATEVSDDDAKRARDLETAIEKAGDRLDKSVEDARAEYMTGLKTAEDFDATVVLNAELGSATLDATEAHDVKVAGFQASILAITESKRIAADRAFIAHISPTSRKSIGRVSVEGILYCRKLGFDFWLDDGSLWARQKNSVETPSVCGPLTVTSLTMFGKYARATAGYLTTGNDAKTSLDRAEKTAAKGNLGPAGGVAGILKVESVGDIK